MRPNRIGAILYELLNFIVCGYVRESLKSHQVKTYHSLPGSLKELEYQRPLAKSLILLFYHYFSLTIPAILPQNYRKITAFHRLTQHCGIARQMLIRLCLAIPDSESSQSLTLCRWHTQSQARFSKTANTGWICKLDWTVSILPARSLPAQIERLLV